MSYKYNPFTDNLDIVDGNPGPYPPGGYFWSDQAVTFNAEDGNGYFCTGTLTVNLPATTADYKTLIIYVDTASTVTVQANTGQYIQVGNGQSSVAGSAVSTSSGSVLELVFRPSDTTWHTISGVAGGWILN